MTRLGFWLSLALCTLSGVVCAEDVIYKCKSPAGSDVYSDKPCAAAKDMQQITIAPAPLPDIADLTALCATEDGARLDLARLDRDTVAALKVLAATISIAEESQGTTR